MLQVEDNLLDPQFGLMIIFIIPIILWYFKVASKHLFILSIIFTLAFVEGSLHFLQILPPSYNKLLREMLVFMGLLSLAISGKLTYIPGYRIILIIIILLIITVLTADVNFFQVIQFTRRIFLNMLVLIYVANLDLTSQNLNRFIRYVKVLFLVQIVIYIIKFGLYGVTEEYIGTIATIGGSLSALITLIGVSFGWSKYLTTQKLKYLFLILGFITLGLIGGKRVILFYVPVIIIVGNMIAPSKMLKNFFYVPLLVPIIFYAVVRLSPTLNPDNEIGGRFDLQYTVDYVANYMEPKRQSIGQSDSRMLAWGHFFKKYGRSTETILLGLGPGYFFPSSEEDSERYGGGGEEYLLNKYKLGYGVRVGALWILYQAGLLFMLFYLYYHLKIFRISFSRLKNRKDYLYIFAVLIVIAFSLDILTYSSSFLVPSVIPLTFYFIFGVILNKRFKQLKLSQFS